MNEKEKLKNYEEALIQIAWELAEQKFANLSRREVRIGEYLQRRGFLNIESRDHVKWFVIPENKEN
jgi:SOS response regulatory protein OraA/RecX